MLWVTHLKIALAFSVSVFVGAVRYVARAAIDLSTFRGAFRAWASMAAKFCDCLIETLAKQIEAGVTKTKTKQHANKYLK